MSSRCLMPFLTKNSDQKEVLVPCGRCPGCLKRRASAWSFRLMEECKISSSANFITLTYDTKHIPISRNGFMDLRVRDLQLFFKRLRKAHSPELGIDGKSIKYYAVGEYGGRSMRPHYHVIMFNSKLELIQSAWQLGHVHYGNVQGASVGYTLKYITKPSKVPLHKNDDRLREFSVMSKGLGKNYLTPAMVAWHKRDLDNRMYLNLEDGKKCSMPRYYKEKLYSEDERKVIATAVQGKLADQIYCDFLKMDFKEYGKSIRDKKEAVHAAYRKQNFKSEKFKV